MNNIFIKTLFRFLKEKNIFNSFKKYSKKIYITHSMSLMIINGRRNILKGFGEMIMPNIVLFQTDNYNNIEKKELAKFFNDKNNNIIFNNILLDLFNTYLMHFISEKNIKHSFLTQVYSYHVNQNHNHLKVDFPNDTEHQDIVFDKYIDYLKERRISPFDFIVEGFSWAYTDEGFNYWLKIDKEFKKNLWEKLLN